MPLMTRHPTTLKTRALPVAMAAVAIAFGTIQPTFAAAIERIAVSEIKPLLMRAAEQGVAHGVLGGTGAAYVQRRFDTTSPIEIDVRLLRAREWSVKLQAIHALAALRSAAAIPALRERLRDRTHAVREAAARAIAEIEGA